MQAYYDFVSQFSTQEVAFVRVGQELYAPGELVTKKAPLVYMTQRLGRIDRRGFHPSVALLDVLGGLSDRKAVLTEKAAWLFLCKRNALKEGIVSCNAEEGEVLVVNARDEILGYGKITGAGITNKLDRGDFLRRER